MYDCLRYDTRLRCLDVEPLHHWWYMLLQNSFSYVYHWRPKFGCWSYRIEYTIKYLHGTKLVKFFKLTQSIDGGIFKPCKLNCLKLQHAAIQHNLGDAITVIKPCEQLMVVVCFNCVTLFYGIFLSDGELFYYRELNDV